MWDRPIESAKFIDKFTKYNLGDSMEFNLYEISRDDLVGILHFLHGFFSQFVSENPDYKETIHCNFFEVVEAIALAESLFIDTSGELCLDEESWKLVKNNPHLTQYMFQLSQQHTSPCE